MKQYNSKKHHGAAPRTLQKRFAKVKENNSKIINTWNKITKEFKSDINRDTYAQGGVKIDSTDVVNHSFSMLDNDRYDDSVELFWATLFESNFADTLNRLDAGYWPPTKEDRVAIAQLVFMAKYKTHKERKAREEYFGSIDIEYQTLAKSYGLDEQIITPTTEIGKRNLEILLSLNSARQFESELYKASLKLIDSEYPLFTGEVPFVAITDDNLPDTNINESNRGIIFPISRYKALIILHDDKERNEREALDEESAKDLYYALYFVNNLLFFHPDDKEYFFDNEEFKFTK